MANPNLKFSITLHDFLFLTQCVDTMFCLKTWNIIFNSPSHFFLAPASVIDLKVEHQGQIDSLFLSWTRGPGSLTGYSVFLDGFEQKLGPESSQVVFRGLVAGRLYTAVVQSWSEDLANTVTAVGRTGLCYFQPLGHKAFYIYSNNQRNTHHHIINITEAVA